jgi:hypothetical protein
LIHILPVLFFDDVFLNHYEYYTSGDNDLSMNLDNPPISR